MVETTLTNAVAHFLLCAAEADIVSLIQDNAHDFDLAIAEAKTGKKLAAFQAKAFGEGDQILPGVYPARSAGSLRKALESDHSLQALEVSSWWAAPLRRLLGLRYLDDGVSIEAGYADYAAEYRQLMSNGVEAPPLESFWGGWK